MADTDNLDDDWAAAMNEQQASGQAEATSAQEVAPEEAAGAVAQAVNAPTGGMSGAITPAQIFNELPELAEMSDTPKNLDMVLDIPVTLTVELGRAKIAIRNLLQLAQGSVVELDGMAGEPMNVLVNNRLIAQGEVVVVNDKFGIRFTDIIEQFSRLPK